MLPGTVCVSFLISTSSCSLYAFCSFVQSSLLPAYYLQFYEICFCSDVRLAAFTVIFWAVTLCAVTDVLGNLWSPWKEVFMRFIRFCTIYTEANAMAEAFSLCPVTTKAQV